MKISTAKDNSACWRKGNSTFLFTPSPMRRENQQPCFNAGVNHERHKYTGNCLTKKSASCRLPSRVISSPGDTWQRAEVRHTQTARVGVFGGGGLRTYPRSMETERPCPPGTTAAQTRTSRRPPRSWCTRTLPIAQ